MRQARAIAPNSEEVLSAYAETSLAAHATLPALSALDALTRLCPTVARYRYLEGAALTAKEPAWALGWPGAVG